MRRHETPSRGEEVSAKPKRLTFDLGAGSTPPRAVGPRSPIGEWMTPPPSTSTAPQPILQRRVKSVKRRPAQQGGYMPGIPSEPSIQMEVVESVETIMERPQDEYDDYDYGQADAYCGPCSSDYEDVSPMRMDLERSFIEEDMRGFKWMDQ